MPHKICIVGLGYVGLPLAVHLARSSNVTVYGYDIDAIHVSSLSVGNDNRNLIPGTSIEGMVNLSFTNTLPTNCKIYMVCVPTPDSNGSPDQSYVYHALKEIESHAPKNAVVVIKSTVVPGSTNTVFRDILEQTSGRRDLNICYSPERINPGLNSFKEMRDEHKLIGIDGEQSPFEPLVAIFKDAFQSVLVLSSSVAAELAKCFENTQRDVNIALFNELSMQCLSKGIDYRQVVAGLRTKPSSPVFHSGFVGGHCIAVDPHYLDMFYGGASIAALGRMTNDYFQEYVANVIYNYVQTHPNLDLKDGLHVLVFGKSYKPDVADTRNSGAIKLYNRLHELNISTSIYDPLGPEKYSGGRTFTIVVGAVNHSIMYGSRVADNIKITGNATFFNVGGFRDDQLVGFSHVINL